MKEKIFDKEEIKKKIAAEYERDYEMVTGVFKHHELKGGVVTFSYRKYHGDDMDAKTFIDGCTYTIPRMIADHLNNDCSYNHYEYIPGDPGVQNVIGVGRTKTGIPKNIRIKKLENRFGFYPNSFHSEIIKPHSKKILQVELNKK